MHQLSYMFIRTVTTMPADDLITDPYSSQRHAMLRDFANVARSHHAPTICAAWDEHRDSVAGARGIFVVDDPKHELLIPDDQDFAGRGFLRCVMGSKRLLNIQNPEDSREFRYGAPIYCDTNFVSFCGTFFRGGDLGANSLAFETAVRFLLPMRDTLNAWAYLFENADNVNVGKIRKSLIAFGALKLTTPEQFETHGRLSEAENSELERQADGVLEMIRGPDFRLVHEQWIMAEHYIWSRVVLLKSALIVFTDTTGDVESRMLKFLGFLDEEFARLPQFYIYVAFRFFSMNQREPFFSGVQLNARSLDRSLKSMAWDLTHWRTLFDVTMMFSRHGNSAAFPVPYFLTFDRPFIQLTETFKLDGLIYGRGSKRCEQFLSTPLLRPVSDLLRGPLGRFISQPAIADRKRRVAEREKEFDARLVAAENELSNALLALMGE